MSAEFEISRINAGTLQLHILSKLDKMSAVQYEHG